MINNTSTFTALDLLNTVIEFRSLTPESGEWSFEKLKENAPRFVRLEQIQSLIWAFVPELLKTAKDEVGEAIQSLYSGEFIRRRSVKHYYALIEEMHRTIAESKLRVGDRRELDELDLEFSYSNLLHYYTKLKELLSHNSGIMEISYPYYFPFIVTGAVSDSIRSQADTIARWLVMFIDPQGKSFTREEMIEEYFYPEDDLTDLDIDWM